MTCPSNARERQREPIRAFHRREGLQDEIHNFPRRWRQRAYRRVNRPLWSDVCGQRGEERGRGREMKGKDRRERRGREELQEKQTHYRRHWEHTAVITERACALTQTHTHTRTAVIRVHVPEKRGVTQFSHEPGEDGNAPYYLSLCFAYFLSLVVFSSVYTATSAWLHSVELRWNEREVLMWERQQSLSLLAIGPRTLSVALRLADAATEVHCD